MKRTLQLLGPQCGEIFIVGSQTFYLPPKSSKGKVRYDFFIISKLIKIEKNVEVYLTLKFEALKYVIPRQDYLSLKRFQHISHIFVRHVLYY